MEKKQGEGQHEGIRQAVKAFSVLGGIGIYLVVFVGICVFLGNLADEKLGLGYMGKLAGILVGFPGALYRLYRQLQQGSLL